MIKIKLEYIAKATDTGKKVSEILKNHLEISQRLLVKLKNHHQIFVNGESVYSSYLVQENDKIEAVLDFQEDDEILMQEMPLEILYENEYLLAVYKMPGIVVHPCSYHPDHTLANGVKYYLQNHKKIRPINRLDKDTSGIVLFAKNEYIQEYFTKIKSTKEYLAIIEGSIIPASGTIAEPIARKKDSLIEREVNENGQSAITHYETLKTFSEYSLLRIRLETGRTHQIRVHLAFKGHPILGDTLYGNSSQFISRQALHAYKLSFVHPITKQQIVITAPLPEDMQKLVKGAVKKVPTKNE